MNDPYTDYKVRVEMYNCGFVPRLQETKRRYDNMTRRQKLQKELENLVYTCRYQDVHDGLYADEITENCAQSVDYILNMFKVNEDNYFIYDEGDLLFSCYTSKSYTEALSKFVEFMIETQDNPMGCVFRLVDTQNNSMHFEIIENRLTGNMVWREA